MVSLDGYIEGPNKELDWHFVDEEFEKYSNNMLHSIDAIVVGRNVYQIFVDYWPQAEENPVGAADPSDPSRHIEAARLINDLPKYVVSTTLKETPWKNSHIIRNNIANEIKKLKDKPGQDIALFGGAGLVHSLIPMNIIDEYRLIVNPVILGNGKPLFSSINHQQKLRLTYSHHFASGAVLLCYKPMN